jgi:hypothetical protein
MVWWFMPPGANVIKYITVVLENKRAKVIKQISWYFNPR